MIGRPAGTGWPRPARSPPRWTSRPPVAAVSAARGRLVATGEAHQRIRPCVHPDRRPPSPNSPGKTGRTTAPRQSWRTATARVGPRPAAGARHRSPRHALVIPPTHGRARAPHDPYQHAPEVRAPLSRTGKRVASTNQACCRGSPSGCSKQHPQRRFRACLVIVAVSRGFEVNSRGQPH